MPTANTYDFLRAQRYEDMRWITLGPLGRPDMNIVLTPPAADPGVTDEERRVIAEMMDRSCPPDAARCRCP